MKLLIASLLIIFLIFFIKHITSLSGEFTDPRTCYEIFTNCDDLVTDDAPFNCNGTAYGTLGVVGGTSGERGRVQVNQTIFLPGTGITVNCDFKISNLANTTRYIWYYNGSNWFTIRK